MRSGLLLLLVALALTALAALLWWRFNCSGKPVAPAAVLATRNHHSLRTVHYEPAGSAPPAAGATAAAEAGAALARLLPPEDLAISKPAQSAQEEGATVSAASQRLVAEEPIAASLAPPAGEEPRPASIRHAAGAVASLLDTLDDGPADAPAPVAQAAEAEPEQEPEPEAGDEPAKSLFHNPLTAPAPTANDQANRAAEIALRQQRRARMSAGAAAQRTALTELFPGAGSPVPTPNPS